MCVCVCARSGDKCIIWHTELWPGMEMRLGGIQFLGWFISFLDKVDTALDLDLPRIIAVCQGRKKPREMGVLRNLWSVHAKQISVYIFMYIYVTTNMRRLSVCGFFDHFGFKIFMPKFFWLLMTTFLTPQANAGTCCPSTNVLSKRHL